ncbi:MAG TPA: FUSC family protein [Streptosporangiaceae bacterium]
MKLREAIVSAAAMLLSYGSALLLEHLAGLNLDVVVLAVVLAISLGRRNRVGAGPRSRLLALVVLAAVSVAAGEVGRLMVDHPNVGDALFTLVPALAIWVRRFGVRSAAAGTLVTMPFIAVLVTPLPLPPGPGAPWWGAAVAVIVFCWVTLVAEVADRTGFTSRVVAEPPAAGDAGAAGAARPRASTRMALQMGVAMGVAFAVGRTFYPDHWTWVVLTAFIVGSGNRGRGDVIYKGLLRVAGAAASTAAATALTAAFGPGDRASVALILAILAVATWLRTFNYAYWAAGVTAALALLYGYFGQGGPGLIRDRLGGILVGAAIAIAASWLVLPVSSSQVLRRRAADVLAVLKELLAAPPGEVASLQVRFRHALARVEQVARPLELHRRLLRRGSGAAHPADAVTVIRGCTEAVDRLGTDHAARAELALARAELARVLRATRPPSPAARI